LEGHRAEGKVPMLSSAHAVGARLGNR